MAYVTEKYLILNCFVRIKANGFVIAHFYSIFVRYIIFMTFIYGRFLLMRNAWMNKEKSEIKRGTLEMIVLHLLSQRELYVYQLIKQIAQKSENRYVVLEGTVILLLQRLEEKELVISDKRLSGKRLYRVYYTITDAGRKRLQELTEIYDEVTLGIKMIMDVGKE